MKELGFRQYLKKPGKKPHVIDGLVSQVRLFETYLVSKHHIELEAAGSQELQDYVKTVTGSCSVLSRAAHVEI